MTHRVIIIADLTGDPKCECLEDVADVVGNMRTYSGLFGLGNVTVYAHPGALLADLDEGHEHVSCSLPTLAELRAKPATECPSCKPGPDEKNHPKGMVFVGWGRGWETCSVCNGTALVKA